MSEELRVELSHFKIINRTGRQLLREVVPLAKPLSLFIEPTNRCNFRCLPCVHGAENTRADLKPLVNMEFDLFERMVHELQGWRGGRLRLLRLAVLGEPLMHPRFADMVQLAKHAGIADRIDTFSNGSLLTAALAEQLVEDGLDYIRFSIYAANQERHRAVTQSAVNIESIRDNIARLKRIRDRKGKSLPFIHVKMFDAFGAENDAFVRMYVGIADEVGFENVNDATRYSGNDLIHAYYGDAEIEMQVRCDYQADLSLLRVCPRPFMSQVVTAQGDVVACTHDAPRITQLGNVHDQGLEEIWNSDAMFQFRTMQLEERRSENRLCAHCDWFCLFPPEDSVDGIPSEVFRPRSLRKARFKE